jgi:hypothetical protein
MQFRQNVKRKGRREEKEADREDEEKATQRPKTRYLAKQANSQKRKREEDSEMAPLPKVAKTDRDGRIGRGKAKVPLEEGMGVSYLTIYIVIGTIDAD